MAAVYILYSSKLDRFYVGSCLNLEVRLNEHKSKIYEDAFTATADDWRLFFSINDLNYKQARAIESHIKGMKSRKYIENLKKYNEMIGKLIARFS